jgi:hypothetical protein
MDAMPGSGFVIRSSSKSFGFGEFAGEITYLN